MNGDDMRSWKIAGAIALGVIVLSIPLYVARETQKDKTISTYSVTDAAFVGRDQCIDCHDDAYQKWMG